MVAVAVQGCAEPPEEVTIESPDPIARSEDALEVSDIVLSDELTVFPLCASVSDTYDYAPWSKSYAGNTRCVKQTTIVPAIGFGTDHETSANFPEFTGLNIAGVGQDTPAQKCRKAGIKVKIRWTSDGNVQTWNYEVPAVPTFAPIAYNPGITLISRVTSCVAKHTSGLGGHGPGQYTMTTTPFTGEAVLGLAPIRAMTSKVEAVF